MKILYVDMLYDYGVKSRGFNTIGQNGFLRSLMQLGHEIVQFYYDDYLSDLPELQKKAIAIADSVSPNLIFFSLYTYQFHFDTLDYLKSKYTTINWFGDDTWRFDSFVKSYANHFSYCITTDKFSIAKYKAIGQENVIYSQWAAVSTIQPPAFSGYKYDISFVGGFHPYRKWFLEALKKRGIRIEVFGHGWPNGGLSLEDMNEVFVSSKINLNLSNSNSYDIRYLWRDKKAFVRLLRGGGKYASQIKARNFEIPFMNGFQLTDYVPTIEDYFGLGHEIICYRDVDEAFMLIKHYLENEDEREKIKEAGHKKAISAHGYEHRLEAILRRVK